MIRSWNKLTVLTIFLMGLTAPTALAQNSDTLNPDVVLTKQKIKEIEDLLGKAKGAIEGLQLTTMGQRADLEKLRADLARLQDRVDSLLTELDSVKKRIATDSKVVVAKSPPTTPNPLTGTLTLTNVYPESLVFYVNKRAYTVKANSTAVLSGFPSGPFTYEVYSPTWGWLPAALSSLPANQTFILSAAPQQ